MWKTLQCLLLIALLHISSVSCSAFPLQILLDKLPLQGDYRTSVLWIVDHENWVHDYYPEWKFPVPKAEVIQKVKNLLSKTSSFIDSDSSNEELQLFSVLLKHYLYNLDDETLQGNEISENISILLKKFPQDYRPTWLLSMHLAKAAKAVESIQGYHSILKKIDQNSLSPYFWLDYAEACYTAGMPVHARIALEYATMYFDASSIEANPIYKAVSTILREPEVGQNVKSEDVYIPTKRWDKLGFLCRLYGLWIPLRPEWKCSTYDSDRDKSFVVLKLGPLKNKFGKNITYSIIIYCHANSKSTFDEFTKEMESKLKTTTMSQVENLISYKDAKTFEWTNSNLYKEGGGGHGYCIFVKRDEPEIRGFSIEGPSLIVNSPGSYRYREMFARYSGPIYYEIFLDSCNDIFVEATAEFNWFLSELIIE